MKRRSYENPYYRHHLISQRIKSWLWKYVLAMILLMCVVAATVAAQVPNVTSFFPNGGSVGTLVSITGTNLTNPTAVTIGGTAAIIVSKTATSIAAMVMPGAITGTVTVTTAGGTNAAATNFTVSAAPVPNTQQGAKLVGTGNVSSSQQGISVALSADGNTAIVGDLQTIVMQELPGFTRVAEPPGRSKAQSW